MSAVARIQVSLHGGRCVEIPAILEKFGDRLMRAALVLSGNVWDADDLRQETLLIAAQKGAGFRGDSQPYTWLYGILLNVDRRRRRREEINRRAQERLRNDQQQQVVEQPSAAERLVDVEWRRGLWSRVAELPEGQRQCLVLRFSEGLKYDEIAVALGCPTGTVKSRIFHGLANLREKLAKPSRDQEQRDAV